LLQKKLPFWQQHCPGISSWFPFLRQSFTDPGLCRQRGAEMISMLGPQGGASAADLVDCLGVSQAAMEAERALLRISAAAVPELLRGLRSRNREIRERSARLLKEFPEHRDMSGPALIRAAEDAEPKVRRQALLTLGELRERKAHSTLLEHAKDENPEVRAAAIEALVKLAPFPEATIESFRAGTRDPFPIVRLEAAKGLWTATSDRTSVVPVLVGILPTQEGWQAAYALGGMGPAAAEAVPALIEILKKEKVARAFRTPPSSSLALGQIREPAIPALSRVLTSPESRVRLAAVLAFGFMGRHALEAIPALTELLRDPDTEVRHVTAITLAGIGAEPKLIMQGLGDCLRAEDIYVRSTAAAYLREIAPEKDWYVAPE
jgi:HEAT repeat protein